MRSEDAPVVWRLARLGHPRQERRLPGMRAEEREGAALDAKLREAAPQPVDAFRRLKAAAPEATAEQRDRHERA
eukprot:9113784-Heterocapsa_arctica.AAC.1